MLALNELGRLPRGSDALRWMLSILVVVLGASAIVLTLLQLPPTRLGGVNLAIPLTGILSASVVVFGYWLQETRSATTNRRQQTMAILMQSRFNQEGQAHARACLRLFSSAKPIPREVSIAYHRRSALDAMEDPPPQWVLEQYREAGLETSPRRMHQEMRSALDGAHYLLNLYEFIAGSLRLGELDEETLWESTNLIVLQLAQLSVDHVEYCLEQSAGDDAIGTPNQLWLNLRWLILRWHGEDETLMQLWSAPRLFADVRVLSGAPETCADWRLEGPLA